jgi:hypothetical protein
MKIETQEKLHQDMIFGIGNQQVAIAIKDQICNLPYLGNRNLSIQIATNPIGDFQI